MVKEDDKKHGDTTSERTRHGTTGREDMTGQGSHHKATAIQENGQLQNKNKQQNTKTHLLPLHSPP